MTDRISILTAQLNPVVGDVKGNLAKARAAFSQARIQDADLIVFPEMFLLGYPPEDLVLKPAAVEACKSALDQLIEDSVRGLNIGPVVRSLRQMGEPFSLKDSNIWIHAFSRQLPADRMARICTCGLHVLAARDDREGAMVRR